MVDLVAPSSVEGAVDKSVSIVVEHSVTNE